MKTCPECNSERVRRGGMTVWTIYLALVALALAAVLGLGLNAAIVGAILIAAIAVVHLVIDERSCLDCGNQWKSPARDDKPR